MHNPKNKCYQDSGSKLLTSNPPMNLINPSFQFQFDKLQQIDDLLTKNDQIYINLRKKLQQISQAEKNITNNINTIRPIYYSSRSKENSLMMYEKFLYDSAQGQKTLQIENFESSTIQTQRPPYMMSKKKSIEQSNIVVVNESYNQQSSRNFVQKSSHHVRENSQSNNFRRTNTTEFNMISQPLIRKSNSMISSQPRININLTDSTNKNASSSNLRQSQSTLLDRERQNFYFPINRSYEPYIDSIVNMNFVELNHRKKEIQQIYDQLKQQQEQIEKAYQQYKKSFTEMNKMNNMNKMSNNNKSQQSIVKTHSPPKKSTSPTKSFFKGKKQQFQPNTSKIPNKTNIQIVPISMKQLDSNNLGLRNQINTNSIPSSNQKLSFSPIKQSRMKYCTDQIQSIDIPEKPQPMTARSHIYIPFNKLYKSPIIQMKNKNILILARQSKLVPQKTAQLKILDGKKYKFPTNVETDEQQLIRNVIKQDHNIVAIVGGQATLKKKLHMALIAHSFDKIIKIINQKQHNCLTFSLSYHELIEKNQYQTQKINNSIEINEDTPIKIVILQAQKTIQEIYEAIKRPHNLNQSSGFSKNPIQSNKDRPKIVRFTKLSLMFGKQCIWAIQVFSANQFTYDFLKNLEVKDIIWSINPLIKNYDEVSKTLNQATKYIENKVQG